MRSSASRTWTQVPLASPSAIPELLTDPANREFMSDSEERTWRWSLSALSPREWMQRVLLLLLLFCCLMGDFVLWQQVLFADWSLLRHLIDSGTHYSVGFCCWGIFLCFSHDRRIPPRTDKNDATPLPVLDESAARESQTEMPPLPAWRAFLTSCLLAGFTAAILDIDHFIAAGAMSIDGATHLKGRPFGHAVTFVIAVTVLVWVVSKARGASKWRRIHRVCFVIITLMSHQIRDGNRLGLWFWPIGSTPGIFYPVYLFMEVALPIALARWQILDGREDNESNVTTDTTRSQRDGDDQIADQRREEHKTPAPPPPQLF